MKNSLPLDGSIEAEYSDGFILSETEHDDVSPYNDKDNILRAILNKDPETEHGPMIRFSVYYKDHRYDIDWVGLPASTRPIRLKHMQREMIGGVWTTDPMITKLEFGYQYNEPDGTNHKEIRTL